MKVHEEHKQKGLKEINMALIIVSTSRFEEKMSEKEISDKTIPLVKSILKKETTIRLTFHDIVPDSDEHIKTILLNLMRENNLDAIIFSGGTGISPKDITYDTIEPLLEKKIEGFGEIFRYLSYKEIGSSAILSRASAGTLKDKAIFILPGSPNAVKLAFEKLILPEIGHMIYLIRKKE
ncbi:MAG: MogA/MoaB family molybdenum cofactor biosynthesis protein [Promethearchaeota archaeon]